MSTELIVNDAARELIDRTSTFVAGVKSMLVRSPHEYKKAADATKAVKVRWNEIEGMRKHLKEPALEACQRIDELFRLPLTTLKEAEDTLKKKQIDFELEQRRLADEERLRREEEARQERERLAEQARIEREEADARAAELRAAGNVAEAITLEHESEARAVELEQQAETVAVAPVHVEIPIVDGNSTRTIWRARVVNAEQVPREFLIVDERRLADYAKAMKDKAKVPGVEFYPEYVKSSRSQ